MEIYALGLLIIVGLIWLALRVSKSAGYKEAEVDAANLELETIKENRKAVYENIHIVNNLSEPERSKLRKKWTRKK